jgi:glutamine synthetase
MLILKKLVKCPYIPGKQTVEFRVPDAVRLVLYHLIAGMIVAAREGILSDVSLKSC